MSKIGKTKRVLVDVESISEQMRDNDAEDNSATERALSNALVLDLIFDHLPKKDWKSARLVNKTWKSTLQLRWRDQFFYKLKDAREDGLSVAGFTSDLLEQEHPTNNPNDLFELNRHPIRNISIKQTYWNKYFILQQKDPSQFWELFGHGLKRIHLERIRIPKGAFLKRLLFELTPNLEEFSYVSCVCDDLDKELNNVTEYTPPPTTQKNLKYLKLQPSDSIREMFTIGNDLRIDYNPRFPIRWVEFLPAFPNVKKLNLQMEPQDVSRPSDLWDFFDAIDIIRKANNNEVLNINELELEDVHETSFNRVDVIKIQSFFASLPISILNIDTRNMSRDKIIALVEALKSTLLELTLWDSQSRKNYDSELLPITILPRGLTKLRIFGVLFPSLEFLSYTPNLKDLKLGNIKDLLQPDVCHRLVAVAPLVNLKKLSYTNAYYKRFEEIDVLAKLMPNVKSCDCLVGADGFRALCRGWVDLEHLQVVLVNIDSEDFFVENLVQLKCLRSLNIECGDIPISDKSVFEGFLKMPSLSKIQLWRTVKMISEEGFEALKRKNCTLQP